jgi:hypothetical protein
MTDPLCIWCSKPITSSFFKLPGTELYLHIDNARPSCHEQQSAWVNAMEAEMAREAA